MDYEEVLACISSVSWKGSVPGLERISVLLQKLGDPQKQMRYVHITGTNGKGSTAAFISHILRAAGYKTGLYISPFIEVFNERMQINNCNISDEELKEIMEYIRPFAESMEDIPTEFEFYTAMALLYFFRNQCDIVVLEVGMGGEFDATNVIPCPEVAVITAIGLDHMEYLGDTVAKIAATKAGIIKPGGKVVLYRQEPETGMSQKDSQVILEVIKKRCMEQNAELFLAEPEMLSCVEQDITGQTFSSEYGDLRIGLAAGYQKYNLAVALKTVEVLNESGYSISPEQIREGLRETTWPGRFEVLQRDPVFLVDGAHNPHGMIAAVKSLAQTFAGKKLIFIFGVLADKDYETMLDLFLPLAKTVLCVTPDNDRALKASDLAGIINQRASGDLETPARAMSCVKEAIQEALHMAAADDVICAIGSLYMIGDVKLAFHS